MESLLWSILTILQFLYVVCFSLASEREIFILIHKLPLQIDKNFLFDLPRIRNLSSLYSDATPSTAFLITESNVLYKCFVV